MSLWGEIRRRNVHRVAIAYVAAAWLLIQVAETLFPVFGLSDMAIRAVVIVLAVGFMPAVVLSWVFEWTPEGFRRDSEVTAPAPATRTRRFDAAIIAMLVLAVAYFAVDKFVFDPVRDTAREAQVAAQARGDAIRQKYGENSIAVLAFDDISEAGDLGYFADGVAEELLNLLAKIPELRVAGRTSAFSFKDKPATIPEIGEALGVTYIVEGSVRTAADRIRITVQLIEAASDTHLFSQNYDRDFGDIFDIQDEVAEKVVDELQISLLGETPHAKRADPRAYALVLQARTMIRSNNDSEEDRARIRSLLERALEIDPNYGEALSLAARSGVSIFPWEHLPEEEQNARLRQMFTRVLASDPNNASVLNWMSWFALVDDNDIAMAAAYKKRAHEADPASYEVLWTSLATLPFFGRPDLTAKIGDYLIERDPLCMTCYDNVADPYIQLGDYASAKARLRDALALDPGFTSVKRTLGNVHLFAGEPERAMELFSEVHAESGWVLPGHLGALYSLDRQEEFDALLPGFVDFFGEESPLVVAQVYAWIGDEDEAFRWLDKRSPDDHWGIRSHLGRAWYSNLHGDPRWQALLEQYQMTDEILGSLDLDLRLPPGVEL
jgi:TolB-like protein/Tfp pilus assembly protein PilF